MTTLIWLQLYDDSMWNWDAVAAAVVDAFAVIVVVTLAITVKLKKSV